MDVQWRKDGYDLGVKHVPSTAMWTRTPRRGISLSPPGHGEGEKMALVQSSAQNGGFCRFAIAVSVPGA